MQGYEILVRALERADVRTVFGTLSGGPSLPPEGGIRYVQCVHAQDAGHAAEGYAVATGRTGVVAVGSGPSATSLVTPVYDAQMDSVPMVVLVLRAPGDDRDEAFLTGLTLGGSKHGITVGTCGEIAPSVAEAFHLAGTGRPGVVVVEIAYTALTDEAEFRWPEKPSVPGFLQVGRPNPHQLDKAADLMGLARRPVIYAGGGVVKADASAELVRLAELTRMPVVTTLMARGAFPDGHRQHLGMPGMHGSVAAVGALQHADLIVALGTRFDDRVTGEAESFAPHARVIHADVDPAEISKNRHADVPIVGDCKEAIAGLTAAFAAGAGGGREDLDQWWKRLDGWRSTYPLGYTEPADGTLSPQYVIESIGALAGPEACYVSGVGQHQMWASQFIPFARPRSFVNSGGLGTMGFAVPAAMGAKIGRPEVPVWAIDGDGCFQMTCRELVVCAAENIPIKVAVINNANLGMVRQLQHLFYGDRFFATALNSTAIPDFAQLAEAYGCVGLRCDRAEDVEAVIAKAQGVDDAPVVIDFVVNQDALVWPMVPAGTSNDEIKIARDLSPTWVHSD